MKKLFIVPVLAGILFTSAGAWATTAPQLLAATPLHQSTADHSKFTELDKQFAAGPEVTAACLKCHNKAAEQVHTSIHWTWKHGEQLGKKFAINNF